MKSRPSTSITWVRVRRAIIAAAGRASAATAQGAVPDPASISHVASASGGTDRASTDPMVRAVPGHARRRSAAASPSVSPKGSASAAAPANNPSVTGRASPNEIAPQQVQRVG